MRPFACFSGRFVYVFTLVPTPLGVPATQGPSRLLAQRPS